MSWVDVRDTVLMHVAANENLETNGRYFCIAETSWHWNDLLALVKEIHPIMPECQDCDGAAMRVTQFDLSRRNNLIPEHSYRNVRTIFTDAIANLKSRGDL